MSEHEKDGVRKTKRKYKPKVKNNRNTEPNPLDNTEITPTTLTLDNTNPNTNIIESKTERDKKRELFLECWDDEDNDFGKRDDHNVNRRGLWEEQGGFYEEEAKREEERKGIIQKI